MTDRIVNDFIAQNLRELTDKGYRCIPAGVNQEGAPTPLGGFREGQQYPSTDPLWQQATMVALCVPDTVMVDLDGYKEGAADAATIAAYMGITPQQLEAARVQSRHEKNSHHWLFRLPAGESEKLVGNCSKWLQQVDLRYGTNNQLIYIKEGKEQRFPPVHAIQPLDLSRMLVPFPQRVAAPVSKGPVTLSDSTSTKGAALLAQQCEELAQQQEGGRNAALNEAALIVGHYVGGGEISRGDAEQALTAAALAIGLSQGETAATVRSGLERGIKEPQRCAMTPAEVFASGLATPTPRTVESVNKEPVMRTGHQYLAGTTLVEHFAGCVYVTGQHRILTPNGDLMRPEVFNAAFGGYVFALDGEGLKTTKKAFEAFTESQCYHFPQADALRFRPEMAPGAIFVEAGRKYVNCYVPAHGERVAGDVSLFIDHMERLIPDAGDREILMSWIASCIQNPGKKHQWSPVLVGTEGNGKSLIGKIVRYALGDRYTAEPRSSQLGGKFNGWIENKLFGIIEEVHMGGRREQMDNMKPLITNTTVEVEGKGRDSYDADNRCNLLLCTNHKDGVIKTANDRRYAIIYTGQQCMGDRARDGMDDAYFTRLWDWLENGGFAACADYFDRYNVTVNVMGNAPRTTATDDAIAQTMGGAEQCIMEAIELERFGFVCGMIRSDALDAMLAERGYKLSPHKRKAALETIGYIAHPVNQQSQVKIAGRPVKVYVKRGHLSAQLAGVDIAARLGTIPENAMADAAVIFSK